MIQEKKIILLLLFLCLFLYFLRGQLIIRESIELKTVDGTWNTRLVVLNHEVCSCDLEHNACYVKSGYLLLTLGTNGLKRQIIDYPGTF